MYQLFLISTVSLVEAGGGKVSGTQSRDMAAAVRKKKKVGDGYQKMVDYVIMCIESSQAGVGGFRGEVLFDQVKSIA